MVNLINTLYNLSTFIGISTDSGRVLPDVYSGWNDVYISTHVRMWENVTISSQNHRWNNDADGLQSHFNRSTQSKVAIQANTCMFLPMYIFIKRKHIFILYICMCSVVFSGVALISDSCIGFRFSAIYMYTRPRQYPARLFCDIYYQRLRKPHNW